MRCLLCALTLLAVSCATSSEVTEKPNVILILADDMRKDDLQFTPKTTSHLDMAFENAFVTYSVCCPSRASILTGKYPHNHRVLDNTAEYPSGGVEAFEANEPTALPVWLQDAGYETALIGKYFNGYSGTRIPPGWNYFFADGAGGTTYNDNGTEVEVSGYQTDLLAEKADEYIRGQNKPFFLYLAPHSPHPPAEPPERYKDEYQDLQVDRGGSFDEADVSDKPPFIQEMPRLTQRTEIDLLYRNRARDLKGLDDAVETVLDALEETGEENTYVVFTSDNGFHMGEHRLKPRKGTAYEEDIRVPLLISGPNVEGSQDEMVLNNDIAPTIAEWTGADIPYTPDGRSLVPLIDDSNEEWRTAFLVEKWGSRVTPTAYKAIRTKGKLYVEHSGGPKELYNLESDPYQLDNYVGSASETMVNSLSARMAEIRSCSGEECRAAEN